MGLGYMSGRTVFSIREPFSKIKEVGKDSSIIMKNSFIRVSGSMGKGVEKKNIEIEANNSQFYLQLKRNNQNKCQKIMPAKSIWLNSNNTRRQSPSQREAVDDVLLVRSRVLLPAKEHVINLRQKNDFY